MDKDMEMVYYITQMDSVTRVSSERVLGMVMVSLSSIT